MGSKNVKLTEAESKRVVARSWVVSKWGYADNTTLMAESEEDKKPLDERGEWKSWLKAQHSEN